MDYQDKCANGMHDTKVAGTLMFVTAEETHGDGTGTMNGKNKPWLSEHENQHRARLEMRPSKKNTRKERHA